MIRWFAVAALLFAACAATAPTPPPAKKEVSAAALVDHSGDSVETAVAVPKDAPNEGI